MAIASKSNATGIQMDSTVSSLTTPFVTASGDAVLVFVNVRSAVVKVLSVTDTAGNVYVKQATQLASDVLQYQSGHYVQSSRNVNQCQVEVWSTIAGATADTSVTVALTGGAKFAVNIQSYTGANATPATAFRAAYSFLQTKTGAPSATATLGVSTSFLVAGFATWANMNFAAAGAALTSGTSRGQISAGSETDSPKAATLLVGDFTGNTAGVVTATPTNQITISNSTAINNVALPYATAEDQFINYGQALVAAPITYGIVAVEVHV